MHQSITAIWRTCAETCSTARGKWAKSRVLVSVSKNDRAIEVVVEDDGPGIPKERIGEVVARGTRLDRTVPGTGIGLAIVNDLVELHGGRLELGESRLGGARVSVHMPDGRYVD